MTNLRNRIKKLLHPEPDSCLACGTCCREFSWHLKAGERDLARWRELGRDDLLARVNGLGWLWVDPETGVREEICPYLVETSPDQTHCSIHDIKPDICHRYPTYETGHRCVKGLYLGKPGC